MKEITPSSILFYIVLFALVFLFERLFGMWFEKEIWSVGMAFISAFIIVIGLSDLIKKYFNKIDDKFEEAFDKEKWFNRIKNIFAFIGIIWTISFIIQKKTYDIILMHPEEKQIEILIKDNWGLREKIYEVKYINREWKYKLHKEGDFQWICLPAVKGVYNKEYLEY